MTEFECYQEKIIQCEQELKEMSPDLREEQLRWFRQDVANSQKPWKLVLLTGKFHLLQFLVLVYQ